MFKSQYLAPKSRQVFCPNPVLKGVQAELIFPNRLPPVFAHAREALAFVPPIFAALYSRKVTASAVFYAILISSLLLFGLFSVLKEQTFVVTTIVSIIITFVYDKIFKRKAEVSTAIRS